MKTKKQKSVRDYRVHALLTQEELAKKSGLTRRTVVRCETANKWPGRPLNRRRYHLGLGLSSLEIAAIEYMIASRGN